MILQRVTKNFRTVLGKLTVAGSIGLRWSIDSNCLLQRSGAAATETVNAERMLVHLP
jgi:hypothetical protein